MADDDFPLLSIIELRTELMNKQRELKNELLKTEHLITYLNDLMDYHKKIAGYSFAQWKEAGCSFAQWKEDQRIRTARKPVGTYCESELGILKEE